MVRSRSLSEHARKVLAALLEARASWSYGYVLCRETGVKSGTLYPLLIRLEAKGYLEAQWLEPEAPGRPPRHAYRLTPSGVSLARENPPAASRARARRDKDALA